MNIVCKNCGANVEGEYCSHCAQKTNTGRLKVVNVLHELFHNFTHADKSAIGLIVDLFVKPGIVIREYIAGKRKKYFNPYTLFLILSAILIFMTKHVFEYEDKLYHFNNEFGQFTSEEYTPIILCSMPFIAGLLKLLFFKRDINYAEWIIFLIFSYCIINVVQIVIQLLYLVFIKYHRYLLNSTEALTYIILLVSLVKFIKPIKVLHWIECFMAMILVFFFVELIAKFIALWAVVGVPFKVLIKNYSIF